jgi:broad specificity phosphatase PhoE
MMVGSSTRLGSGWNRRPPVPNAWVLASLLLFVAILGASAQSTIFVVRHAEKADAANDPDLSPAGRARAEVLAKVLRDANITAIYTTEFKRTQETAAPLANALGIEVTIVPAAATADLATKLKSASGNALVVGHTNTIPDLVKTLGIAAPLTLTDADYDNLFIVVLEEKPRLLRLHF